MAETTTEYTITMSNMDNEDLYFDDYEQAKEEFDSIKDTDKWSQFFRKDWVLVDGDWHEDFVEVYANNDK